MKNKAKYFIASETLMQCCIQIHNHNHRHQGFADLRKKGDVGKGGYKI